MVLPSWVLGRSPERTYNTYELEGEKLPKGWDDPSVLPDGLPFNNQILEVRITMNEAEVVHSGPSDLGKSYWQAYQTVHSHSTKHQTLVATRIFSRRMVNDLSMWANTEFNQIRGATHISLLTISWSSPMYFRSSTWKPTSWMGNEDLLEDRF